MRLIVVRLVIVPVRRLSGLAQYCGICDRQSPSQKAEQSDVAWRRSQGRTVGVRDTPVEIAAKNDAVWQAVWPLGTV